MQTSSGRSLFIFATPFSYTCLYLVYKNVIANKCFVDAVLINIHILNCIYLKIDTKTSEINIATVSNNSFRRFVVQIQPECIYGIIWKQYCQESMPLDNLHNVGILRIGIDTLLTVMEGILDLNQNNLFPMYFFLQ